MLNGLLLLVPGLFFSITFFLSNKFIFGRDFGFLNLIYVVIFVMVAVLVSSFELVKRDRGEILFMIESELTAFGQSSVLQEKYLYKNAASYLHNMLQSELLSITKQLETSSGVFDSLEARIDIEKLLDRFNRPIKEDFQKFISNPIDRLNRLQSAWKGIAEIEVDIPAQALKDHSRNILLVQIVEEAIANAIRHAGATQVKVTAETFSDTRIRFSVINNGISSKGESLGLGSSLLDYFAPNSWSRKKLENGSELAFTL
jgi:signal transduction histidine kinase